MFGSAALAGGLLLQHSGVSADGRQASEVEMAPGPARILVADSTNTFTRVAALRELVARPATATISVTYNGFSAAAQTAFQSAIDIWQTQLTSTVPIQVVANFTSLGPGILGSAGSNFVYRNFANGVPNTYYAAALANKLAGSDLNPSQHDITANFNSNFTNWYFGTDGNTPSGQYDFKSVVLHELCHGLGFFGSMDVSGGSGSYGLGTQSNPTIYDTFAVNGSVQSLVDTSLFANPSAALASQLTGGNLFWNGAQGISGAGGTRPKLYAPSTWSDGSSFSHLDEATYPPGNANSLMTYAIGSAEAIHDPGPITRGMFTDMGWTTVAGCSYTISPISATVGAGAATGSVSVTTSSGCTWTATSNSSFLTITGGASGSGNGTVSYSVAANSGAARTGTLTIAGQTFTVTQSAFICSYSISPTSASFGAGAGTGSVSITTTSGCTWTATSNASFIIVTAGGSGTGSGTVGYSVTVNGTGAARNGTLTIAGHAFTVTQSATAPTLTLDRMTARYGFVTEGTLTAQTTAQTFTLTQNGLGTVPWTVAANRPWLTVSPASGTGTGSFTVAINNTGSVLPASGTVTGTVTITAPAASNSPQTLTVTLVVYASTGSTTAPMGSWDTPAANASGISGSLALTGWALDDTEVSQIRLYRASFGSETPGQQIFLGTAVFVAGARPDIEAANPTLPFNYRAGWGYLLLTNVLPSGGNGTYTLYAYADDREGRTTLLGTRNVTIANSTATKPFGTIDTPAQGATISGSAYVNFGWTLTPLPKAIPTDGSTITVFIDGVAQGTVTYNQFRSDIAGLFPGYANTNGAVGLRTISTTLFANGVHTMSWAVFDNTNVGEGIGSRYFTIQNGSSSLEASDMAGVVAQPFRLRVKLRRTAVALAEAVRAADPGRAKAKALRYDQEIMLRRGFDDDAPAERLQADDEGMFVIEAKELERLVIDLGAHRGEPAGWSGSLRVGDELRALPIGSTLDASSGRFSWGPGPGFLGRYDLLFVRTDHRGAEEQITVWVTLRPQY